MNKKDIINKNDRNQYHGYQEMYNENDKLNLRTNTKNNNPIGYYELHLHLNKRIIYFIR